MSAPYETLGVGKDAAPEEIKAAYRKLAMFHHPDRGGTDEAFSSVNAAYELLSNPERRSNYDKTGETGKVVTDALEAEKMVTALFDQYLLKPGALLEHARDHLRAEMDKASQYVLEAQQIAGKLRKRREKIKVKEGQQNVVHMLIDTRMEVIQRSIELARKCQRVSKLALEMVNSYQSTEDALEGLSFMTSTMRC